jgi:hypothetical protein
MFWKFISGFAIRGLEEIGVKRGIDKSFAQIGSGSGLPSVGG